MKQFIQSLFVCCIIGFTLASCQKNDSAIAEPIEEATTTDTVSNDHDYEVTERSAGSWDVNLANFRYVWQNRRPTQWTNDSKYAGTGYPCSYPQYSGTYQFTEGGNTNLCGIASHMMGVHIVNHPALFDVPYGTNDRAIRLAEYAKRYKIFHAGWNFGNFCSIANIANMGKGLTNKKGDLTNWSQCSTYIGSGTTWGGSTNRSTVKAFFESKISTGKPCVAIVMIAPSSSCQDANCSTYIRTNGTGTGHMVLVTGLTTNAQGIGTIRFKDPWPNDSSTYSVDYDKFMDSMKSASSLNPPVYNVYCINGY